MTHLDAATLRAAGACRDGLAWIEAELLARGDEAPDALIERMLAQGRTDFYAWGFLKMAALRRRGLHERMRRVMGPRYAQLGELADAVDRMAWLAPHQSAGDTEAPGTGRAEDADVEGIVSSHVRRLSAFGFAVPRVLRVERVTFADAFAATAATASAVVGEDGLPPQTLGAWCAAYWRARRRLRPGAPTPESSWFGVRRAVEEHLLADLQRALPPGSRLAAVVHDTLGGMATCRTYGFARSLFARERHGVAWATADRVVPAGAEVPQEAELAHHPQAVRWAARLLSESARRDVAVFGLHLLADVQTPSPAEPLLDLWARGLWPAGLVEDTFVVGDPRLRGTA